MMKKTVALLAVAGLAAATSEFQDDYLALRLTNATATHHTNHTAPIRPHHTNHTAPIRPTHPHKPSTGRITLSLKDMTKEERELAIKLLKRQHEKQHAHKTNSTRPAQSHVKPSHSANATAPHSTKPAFPKRSPLFQQRLDDDEFFADEMDDELFVDEMDDELYADEVDDELFADDDFFFAEDDFFAAKTNATKPANSTHPVRPIFRTLPAIVNGTIPRHRINGTAFPHRPTPLFPRVKVNATHPVKPTHPIKPTQTKPTKLPIKPTTNSTKVLSHDDELYMFDDELYVDGDDELWVDVDLDDELFADEMDDEYYVDEADNEFFAPRTNSTRPVFRTLPARINGTLIHRPVTMIPRPRVNATQPFKPTPIKPTLQNFKPTMLPLKHTTNSTKLSHDDELWVDMDDEFFADEMIDDEYFVDADDEFFASRLHNRTHTAKPHSNSTLGRLESLLKEAKNATKPAFHHIKHDAKNHTAHGIHGAKNHTAHGIHGAKNHTAHGVHTQDHHKNATHHAAPKKGFLSMF